MLFREKLDFNIRFKHFCRQPNDKTSHALDQAHLFVVHRLLLFNRYYCNLNSYACLIKAQREELTFSFCDF